MTSTATPVTPLPPVRRVVTANDGQGQSFIAADGPSPATLTHPARPGYANANLWRTTATPAPVDAPDSVQAHAGVLPPRCGTVLRVIDFPPQPQDPEERARQTRAVFKAMYPDATEDHADGKAAGMHRTDTVDYAIVLAGEIIAVMDKEETVLRAGDVLVQRGTNHAWLNLSDRIARVAFVLIDGRAR